MKSPSTKCLTSFYIRETSSNPSIKKHITVTNPGNTEGYIFNSWSYLFPDIHQVKWNDMSSFMKIKININFTFRVTTSQHNKTEKNDSGYQRFKGDVLHKNPS